MATWFLLAQLASAATLLALLLSLVSLRRRADVPSVTYGGVTLTQGRMKAIWVAFLVGSLIEASNNDPIVVRTGGAADPVAAPAEGGVTRQTLSLPLPFYRYERARTTRGGVVLEEEILEGIVLPWSFFTALVGYYILVVRWNPESRWARRILEGKRKRRGPEATE